MTPRTRSPRRALRAAALAILAAGALAVPAGGLGAVAAVQDDALTHTPLETLGARLDVLASSGAKVTRFDVFWSDVAPTRPARPGDPSDPAYRWDRVDAVVRGLAQRGISPIITVYSSPRWASGNRASPDGLAFNPWAPDPGQFGKFMGAIARRYSGAFTLPDGTPLPEVRMWELWNEPNLVLYLRPQLAGGRPVSIARYAAMVRAAYPAIKRANEFATVIAGVGGPKGATFDDGVGALEWLKGLVKLHPRFDAYSQHIYPAAPPTAKTPAIPQWNSIPLFLKELDKLRRGMPLFVTEAGYTTEATPYRRVRVSPAKQRLFLRQIFGLPQVRSRRVPVVVWFNLQDNPNWPGGLLRANGAPKPSFATFRAIAKASRVPDALMP